MEPSRIVEKPESGASESHQEAGVSPVNQKTEVQMASKVGRAKQSIEGGEASSKAQPFHSDPDELERASAPDGAKSSQVIDKPESGASESHQEAGASSMDQTTKVQKVSKVGRAATAQQFPSDEQAVAKEEVSRTDPALPEKAPTPEGTTERSVEETEVTSKVQPFHSDESKRASAPDGATDADPKLPPAKQAVTEAEVSRTDLALPEEAPTLEGTTEQSIEEAEVTSKAQPFHSDESGPASTPDGAKSSQLIEKPESNVSGASESHREPDASSLDQKTKVQKASKVGKAERSEEGGERPTKAQPFDTDSNESRGASAPDGASDIRIEDVFADIARKFTSFIHFKMFALSGNGLRLTAGEVSTIIADNPDSVEDKKFGMLDLWKEKNGTRASPTHIAEIIQQYFRQERGGVTGSRIEDAFLAVPKVFDNAALFQRFALSGKGLSLSMHEVGNIKENARNVEERNLDLLVLWKLKTGDSATTEKIWQLVNAFLDERGESHPGKLLLK
uniref:enolase-phosphatase E1-like isoform X1 n=1 Tax=Styela clava TaxID=7725 RepID=UPI001939A382|nr:enolase-phosphatase E1-like isoform X1 [Styela clava]